MGIRNGTGLTAPESTERDQLQELLSQVWRDCPECLGVGRIRFAYTGIVTSLGYMVTRVEEDQAGHTPQAAFGSFPSHEAAQGKADELNRDLGWDPKAAYEIVTSSLRAENIRERDADPRARMTKG